MSLRKVKNVHPIQCPFFVLHRFKSWSNSVLCWILCWIIRKKSIFDAISFYGVPKLVNLTCHMIKLILSFYRIFLLEATQTGRSCALMDPYSPLAITLSLPFEINVKGLQKIFKFKS